LTGVEDLVRRIYSMSEASPVNAALEKQARSVLALYRDGLGVYKYGFLTLVEKVITTLRRMSTLQVTSFAEEPVLPASTSEGTEISWVEPRGAPVPEPVSVRLTRETPSIGTMVRRMIRRLWGRTEPAKHVEEVVTEEGRPRLMTPRPTETVSVPEIRERVVAKAPPLFTHPTEPDEPEHLLRLPEDLELEAVASEPERPVPAIPRARVTEKLWRPTPKVAQVSEMGRRIALLAVARRTVPRVRLQASVVDTMVETTVAVRDTVVDRVEAERRRAAPLNWSPVVIEAMGVPAAVRAEPMAPSTGVPEPSPALVGFPRVTETVEPTGLVLEREAESRAAQVASQMSRLSKGVAERVAQVYRRSVTEKLPPAERLKGDAVTQAPALDEKQTRRAAAVAASLQKAEALEGAQREKARELRSLPAMLELTLVGSQIAAASREAGTTFSEALRRMTDSVPEMAAAGARATGLASAARVSGVPDSAVSTDHIKGIGVAFSHVGYTVTDSFKNMAGDLEDGLLGGNLLDTGLDGLMEDGPQDKDLDDLGAEGLLASIDGLIGDHVLERATLDGVPPIPGMRLHEVLPVLTRNVVQQPSTPRRPEARPRPSYERPKPIEVKVDARMEDMDLKELERKIARILRDEARRYGVIR